MMKRFTPSVLIAFLAFLLLGCWQLLRFQVRQVDDYYQPNGYIEKVNDLIHQGKIYYEPQKTANGYRPMIHTARLDADDESFYEKSWLKEDVQSFNEGNSEMFLIDRGKLQGVNIYTHRIESPLASDWNWWGRIFSQSSDGYAYLWNSRRTLKLYRPSLEERASAKIGQSEFREVVYGRGHLFQTGFGITLKGRAGNRIADVYSMGENIVLKSYGGEACSINGYPLAKGQEQRLEEGDLIQIRFGKTEREEFLFHDFSQKPLSFVNVLNGHLNRTNLDTSFHFIDSLTNGIETSLRKTRTERKAKFDVHLALDEDLSGLTQVALDNYSRQLSAKRVRASCTIMDAVNGNVLATASESLRNQDSNENFKLHPVGSSTKIFMAASVAQAYPDLTQLEIDPYPAGEEKNLLGYELKQGVKLLQHHPFVGESGRTDFTNYLAKSSNRYHAILMVLALAKDSAAATGKKDLLHGIAFTSDSVDESNGKIYWDGDVINRKPDLGYFVSQGPGGALECNNLESSELALNLSRFFDVKRKVSEGSTDFFAPEAWNLLFARLGLQQRPDLYPAFYSVMPQTVNLGFNLNIDFRLDFISILFGGATNRWNNIKLAEATSRLVTGQKVEAHFVDRIMEGAHELKETKSPAALDLNPEVQKDVLQGMEAVVAPGGTAGDLFPLLENLKSQAADGDAIEFYGKTGTPFRKEIRKGEEEIYSSVFLFTAVLRDRNSGKIQDALTFSIYIEDQGEHKAVEFLKTILPKVLAARRWTANA